MKTKNLVLCSMTLLMSSAACFAQSDNEDKVLVHMKSGGEVQETALSEINFISFGESDFSFVKANGTTAYSYEEVAKLTFALAGIGVADTEAAANELVLFPNPATDYVNVRGWESDEPAVLSVYSLSGQCCMEISSWNGEPVSVAGLERGMYILKVNEKTFKFRKS